MVISQTVLIKARNAGFRTFLACWLASALFVAPLMASHQGFAHVHPAGTAFHFHAINTFLISDIAISHEISVTFAFLFYLTFPSLSSTFKTVIDFGFFTRAPPLL